MSEILVVDDERSMREFLEILFGNEGHRVRVAASAAEAERLIAERPPDLLLTDLKMRGPGGLELLRSVKGAHPEVEVVVITAFATDETAIEAIRIGAHDYVTKPFQVDEIRVVAQRALERQRLLRENARMRFALSERAGYGLLVGRGARMQEIYHLIEQVAPTRTNVLITGESGTGKELVARAIHERSDRRKGPFVAIDCGSIPETLMESELFGAVRGAYTGAVTDRKGLFELADSGTAFLDEIAEVPPGLQVKLLRVLQERSLKRLGDTKERAVDVRVLAATNRDIEQEVKRGAFREDLFYRLNVIRLHLPPLRERREDIPDLVLHFIDKIARAEGRAPPIVLPEAVAALAAHDFPGNVRELQNMIERAVALSGHRPIGPELVTEPLGPGPQVVEVPTGALPAEGVDLDGILASVERRLIGQALQAAGGTKKEAARLLGVSFRSFRYRLAKLGIE